MGACNFDVIKIGKYKNANHAYKEACNEALVYYGHQEGYNGTISTTSSFQFKTDAPKYGTKKFIKWEEDLINKLNKRDCVCVEITGKTLSELKEKRGFKGKKGIKGFYFFGWAAE